jgi:hypothetical protein
MSGSSINQLVSSLRRVTAETQGKLRTAAEAVTPPPALPAAAAAVAAEAADISAAAGSASMHELVAALRRGMGEDQASGASSGLPSRLLLTPQAAGQTLDDAQHENQQQQQQQDALIQQLLLQTQPGENDAQLCFQQQAGSSSYLKAAWGSGGGDEASCTPAAAGNAAAASSGGVEQLLAALRGPAASEGVTACSSVQEESLGKSEQHAEADTTKSSAVQLALLLQGQQHQQAASACTDVETAGASNRRVPDAAAAVLGGKPAAHVASTQQQQQYSAAALEMSQSPLRARQLQYGEASPGAAGDSSQPEFTQSVSQLVHALQDTGDNQAGRNVAVNLAPGAAALGAHPDTTAAAAAAAEAKEDIFWSIYSAGKVADAVVDGVGGVARISDMYSFPTSTPPEEGQLQAAAEAPLLQQTAAQPAEAAAEPLQQQRQPAAAMIPAQDASQQHSSASPAAAAGLQPCSLSSMAVAFDPRIPAELEQELAAAVVAAGGSVVPGQPHLGCGANTVVAEPQHAAQWLQLLMHIVSPAWLLKACRQQQRQQGCRQQQLMCLSPDVARALGQGGRQHDGAAAAANTGVENSMCADSGLSRCSNATSPTDAAAAAHMSSSSTVGATGQAAGNSDSSSICRVRGTVLLVPEAALSVEGMGLWLTSAAAAGASEFGQQQPQLMPPGLLEGVVWSVDQDPRCV